MKLRQPLRRAYVRGAGAAAKHVEEIAAELRVKYVGFDEGPVARVRILPNLRVLVPRLGPKVTGVRAALERGDFEELDGGRVRVAGEDLASDDIVRGSGSRVEGWTIAEDDGVNVAIDIELDDELRLEGRADDLIHALNAKRRESGLELTDRIEVTLPERDAELLAHADWIMREVLARRLGVASDLEEPLIEKV